MRGLWRRIRRVMTDTGQRAELPIHLERAADGSYGFRLGVSGEQTARIPVDRRANPDPHPILKEIHSCEVAGQHLEAANVHALRAKAAAALEMIAPGRTLPLCYFRAPAMDYELAVYEEGGRLHVPVMGGPRLRATDLAGIRRDVCRYLVSAGYVASPEQVTVGVLRPSDLRRVPPAAVFRSLDDPEVWVPSVEGSSPEGPVVGVIGQPTRLRMEERPRAGAGPRRGRQSPAAPDVVELLRYLRTQAERGGLGHGGALVATHVRPEIWAAAEARAEPAGRVLVAHLDDEDATRLELAILRTGFGELAAALEDRGINVFLAATEDDLAGLVGRHLAAAGFLRFAADVELHDAEAPRAEHLDPEAITLHPEPEEVR
jgi:hypothetical protein